MLHSFKKVFAEQYFKLHNKAHHQRVFASVKQLTINAFDTFFDFSKKSFFKIKCYSNMFSNSSPYKVTAVFDWQKFPRETTFVAIVCHVNGNITIPVTTICIQSLRRAAK